MTTRSNKLAPSLSLSPYVSYLRATDGACAHATPYTRLPDGELELVLRVDQLGSSVHVVGTRLRALHKQTVPAHGFVTLRFKAAGAYPFFGLPISALTDQLVPLESLWRADYAALHEELAHADSDALRCAALERALSRRLREASYEPASATSVRRAVRLLRTHEVLPSVDALASQLGASTRQLRRAFADTLGVGPKQYLRILRFQRAVHTARLRPALPWSRIAQLAGFCDQPHLNEEFLALAGVSPGALRAQLLLAQPAR